MTFPMFMFERDAILRMHRNLDGPSALGQTGYPAYRRERPDDGINGGL